MAFGDPHPLTVEAIRGQRALGVGDRHHLCDEWDFPAAHTDLIGKHIVLEKQYIQSSCPLFWVGAAEGIKRPWCLGRRLPPSRRFTPGPMVAIVASCCIADAKATSNANLLLSIMVNHCVSRVREGRGLTLRNKCNCPASNPGPIRIDCG